MKVEEYPHTDGMRRWELLFEGLYLVLLREDAPKPSSIQLLAFEGYGSLVWQLSPQTKLDNDHIANIWVKDGALYAGSYSGYSHLVDHKTGAIVSTNFTK